MLKYAIWVFLSQLLVSRVAGRMSKRNLTRICCICDGQFAPKVFEDHFNSHQDDLKYLPFSNDMKDACRTTCRLCDREMIQTRLRSHTKDKHGMSITDYKAKFNLLVVDITEKVFHKCALCSDILLLDSDTIAQHLHKHDITHRTYNDKYMNMMVKHKTPQRESQHFSKTEPKSYTARNVRPKLDISNIAEGQSDSVSLGTGSVTSDVSKVLDVSQEPMDVIWAGELFNVPDGDDSQNNEEVEVIDVDEIEEDEPLDVIEDDSNNGTMTRLKSRLASIFQKPRRIQKGQRSRRFLSHYDMHLIAWPHDCQESF